MWCAVYDGPLKSIDCLIWKGANVDSISTDRYDSRNAVVFGSPSVRRYSMLHYAASRIDDAVVVCETLVACGSEIEVTDGDGLTPLMWDVREDLSDIVRSLLALNADTAKTNNQGWKVSQTHNAEILQLLSEHPKKTVSLIALQTKGHSFFRFRLWNVNRRAWKH